MSLRVLLKRTLPLNTRHSLSLFRELNRRNHPVSIRLLVTGPKSGGGQGPSLSQKYLQYRREHRSSGSLKLFLAAFVLALPFHFILYIFHPASRKNIREGEPHFAKLYDRALDVLGIELPEETDTEEPITDQAKPAVEN